MSQSSRGSAHQAANDREARPWGPSDFPPETSHNAAYLQAFRESFADPASIFALFEDHEPTHSHEGGGWLYTFPDQEIAILRITRESVPSLSTLESWHQRGLPVPRPIARVSRVHDSALALRLPRNSVPLDRTDLSDDNKIWWDLGRRLTRLHQAGWVFDPMPAWGLWHSPEPGAGFFGLELHRLKRVYPFQVRLLSRSWGSLLSTLPARLKGELSEDAILRQMGLKAWTRRRGAKIAAIDWSEQGLVPREVVGKVTRGRGRDWVRIHPLLQEQITRRGQGLRFEDWFPEAKREDLRRLDDRANSRVRFEMAGGTLTAYLKWHHHELDGEPQGPYEWDRHCELRGAGLPTPLPAACGLLGNQSFFLSFEIPEGRPLDRLLEKPGRLGVRTRRRVLYDLSRVVGRLHRYGFAHRDLYLCHLYWNPRGLVLLDLQRVERHLQLPLHRRVKDLAALLYSSWAGAISDRDRALVYRAYRKFSGIKGVTRGGLSEDGLASLVQAKAKWILKKAGPPGVGGREA